MSARRVPLERTQLGITASEPRWNESPLKDEKWYRRIPAYACLYRRLYRWVSLYRTSKWRGDEKQQIKHTCIDWELFDKFNPKVLDRYERGEPNFSPCFTSSSGSGSITVHDRNVYSGDWLPSESPTDNCLSRVIWTFEYGQRWRSLSDPVWIDFFHAPVGPGVMSRRKPVYQQRVQPWECINDV